MGPVSRLTARRRYREMARRLAELDALDREHGLGAVGHTPTARRRRPGLRARRVLASMFALSMVGMVVVLGVVSRDRSGDGPAAAGLLVRGPASEVRLDRIRPAVPVVSAGPHVFLDVSPTGQPVGFDPCAPVHYVVNPVGIPPGGAEQLRGAVREMSDATGLQFIDDGVTTERLTEDRKAVQPDRYGTGWAPVLIAWVDETEFPRVGGDVVGATRSEKAAPVGSDVYRYVTGVVALDRSWFARALADPTTATESRITLLHELGHLVGLDHVNDPNEVMDGLTEAVQLGPGDRQGLAIVGSGGCRT